MTIIFCLFLFINNLNAEPLILTDLLKCIEHGHCGLSNICSFSINQDKDGHEHEDSSSCSGYRCKNLTGHIMIIKNNLDVNLTFAWDVIGDDYELHKQKSHQLFLNRYSSRYFNTKHYGSHTVRLYYKEQSIMTIVAGKSEKEVCTSEKACDYLMRSCLPPYSFDDNCAEYANFCHGFINVADYDNDEHLHKTNILGDQCIKHCMSTHYSYAIPNSRNVNTQLVMDFTRKYAVIDPKNKYSSKITLKIIEQAIMSQNPGSSKIAIIILSVIVVILVCVIIISWVWRRKDLTYRTYDSGGDYDINEERSENHTNGKRERIDKF